MATLPNKPQKHVGPYYYTGLEILGQGQFGVVHKGYRTSDGTPVAIKVIPKKQRLARELDILTRLDHPNVVKMLHYEEDAHGTLYVVLEYVGGGTLSQFINRKPLTEGVARRFLIQISLGLQYLHKEGIVHRDLKPDNILLVEKSATSTLKIADFGFARLIPSTETGGVMQSFLGTPLYSAPEINSNTPYDASADLWSVGCIFYEMLNGQALFYNARTKPELLELLQRIPWPTTHMSDDAKALIQGLLQMKPASRLTFEGFFSSKYLASTAQKDDMDTWTQYYYSYKDRGQRYCVEARSTYTVLHLKIALEALTGVPPVSQILLLKDGQELEDNKTLTDYCLDSLQTELYLFDYRALERLEPQLSPIVHDMNASQLLDTSMIEKTHLDQLPKDISSVNQISAYFKALHQEAVAVGAHISNLATEHEALRGMTDVFIRWFVDKCNRLQHHAERQQKWFVDNLTKKKSIEEAFDKTVDAVKTLTLPDPEGVPRLLSDYLNLDSYKSHFSVLKHYEELMTWIKSVIVTCSVAAATEGSFKIALGRLKTKDIYTQKLLSQKLITQLPKLSSAISQNVKSTKIFLQTGSDVTSCWKLFGQFDVELKELLNQLRELKSEIIELRLNSESAIDEVFETNRRNFVTLRSLSDWVHGDGSRNMAVMHKSFRELNTFLAIPSLHTTLHYECAKRIQAELDLKAVVSNLKETMSMEHIRRSGFVQTLFAELPPGLKEAYKQLLVTEVPSITVANYSPELSLDTQKLVQTFSVTLPQDDVNTIYNSAKQMMTELDALITTTKSKEATQSSPDFIIESLQRKLKEQEAKYELLQESKSKEKESFNALLAIQEQKTMQLEEEKKKLTAELQSSHALVETLLNK